MVTPSEPRSRTRNSAAMSTLSALTSFSYMDQSPLENMWGNTTTTGVEPKAADYLVYKVGQGIQTYYVPFIVTAGLIGNILSFIVMTQPQNRVVSFCIYLSALAVGDSLMLVTSVLYWIQTELSKQPWRGIYCQLLYYFFHAFSFYGVWVIIFMTVDRYVAIRFPLRNFRLCRPRNARMAVLAWVPLTFLIKFPHPLCCGVTEKDVCAGFVKDNRFCRVTSWAFLFTDSIVPFAILLVLNVSIAINVRRSRRLWLVTSANGRGSELETLHSTVHTRKSNDSICVVTDHSNPNLVLSETESGRSQRDSQLTAILLLVSFSLLILTIPIYARYVTYAFLDREKDAKAFAVYVLVYNITNKTFMTNNSINFILYCLSGSKFRRDLTSMVCRKHRKRNRPIRPRSN